MRVADTHVEVANKRVPDEKRLRFEVVPIDPVRTEVVKSALSRVSYRKAIRPV